MPNRIIKESIRISYDINELSPEAEVSFYRLLTYADDFGRFPSDIRILQSQLFPLKASIRSKDLDTWMSELVNGGLIELYIGNDNKPYGHFPTWEDHQNRRANQSKYPNPPGDGKYFESFEAQLKESDLRRKQMISHDSSRKQMQADDSECSRTRTRTRTRYSNLDTREVSQTPEKREFDDGVLEIANHLRDSIVRWEPEHRYSKNPPSLKSWCTEIERAIRLDGRNMEQLKLFIDYIFTQNTSVANFWKPNIQSGGKLREKFDQVVGQIKNEIRNGTKKSRGDTFYDKLF